MQLFLPPKTISAFQRFLGMVVLIISQKILPIPLIYNKIPFLWEGIIFPLILASEVYP